MKTILLPTDFSKNSINAIHYAIKLLAHVKCDFYLLNVQKASSFISDDMMTVTSSATIYNTLIDAAKKSISNIVSQIEKRSKNENHAFHSIVDYDNFIDAINQISKKHHVDLIIMGTKGASGLEKVIFGSNTVHVMQRCQIPVLAIPKGCTFKGLSKIAFTANNLLGLDIKTLVPLRDLVSFYKSNLSVLHIADKNHLIQSQETIFDFFKIYFIKVNHDFIDTNIKEVYNVVHKYIVDNGIQMLSIMDEQHSFLERLFTKHPIETFAFAIDIPFLVMKKQK
ncbi:MAG: universal stress protein [Flavobacteriaceae bacterium]|tara:strand:+ start:200 stop:1042 length:843 start_codon:yes stop_codon:yes gene_type:complete